MPLPPRKKMPGCGGNQASLRRGWDSNPRYPEVHLISSQAQSTTLPPLLFWAVGFWLLAIGSKVYGQRLKANGPWQNRGGETGIRTLDTLLTYTHFPGALLKPLGHLSRTCCEQHSKNGASRRSKKRFLKSGGKGNFSFANMQTRFCAEFCGDIVCGILPRAVWYIRWRLFRKWRHKYFRFWTQSWRSRIC